MSGERAEVPPGAFRHQHGDPRTLRERIDAQIRERIEEALEMAALEVMVEQRRREGRPAPEEGSGRDRDEFRAVTASLLAYLDQALGAAASSDDSPPPSHGSSGSSADTGQRDAMLASQVVLAKRMPDYWQVFEVHRTAFAEQRVGAASRTPGWLRRLFSR